MYTGYCRCTELHESIIDERVFQTRDFATIRSVSAAAVNGRKYTHHIN
jgi:hypothetical protein